MKNGINQTKTKTKNNKKKIPYTAQKETIDHHAPPALSHLPTPNQPTNHHSYTYIHTLRTTLFIMHYYVIVLYS